MFAKRRCPRTLSIGMFATVEALVVSVVERLVGIVDGTPVRQILRHHNRNTWSTMHSGAHHIVFVPITDDGRVWHIRVDERVGYGDSKRLECGTEKSCN